MDFNTDHQEPQPVALGKRIGSELWDLLKIFAICFVVVYLLTNFVAKPIRVEGSSMYPTLEDGELGITNVLGVTMGGVERFDVVIIHNSERDEYWVKRVIGLPGETIEAKDDTVYINGEKIEQSFLATSYVQDIQKDESFTSDFDPVKIGEDEYYLMGDNRIRSEDSRVHGPFKREEIVGKDVFVIFPFDKFKIIRNPGS